MNKDEALYFLEGVAVGFAAPTLEFVQKLLVMIANDYDITYAEAEDVRVEMAAYLLEEAQVNEYKQ